jgi:CelD/BcsL family acetyltransferase involved in cellulose biosynthesis
MLSMIKGKTYPINNGYIIREVNDFMEFKKSEETWERFVEKQGESNPFLSFEWFKIWLENFLKNDSLLILLLYRGDQIVAIAPLLSRQEKFKGIKVRKIELIGNIYSPVRYFIFNKSNNIEEASVIFEFFRKFYRNWDVIDLYGIPEENGRFKMLMKAIIDTGFNFSHYSCFGDWYLDGLECSGKEYFSSLPKRIVKDISYNQRRLQRIGKYEFRLISNHDVDRYVDLYYGVYSKSWQREEYVGPNFHRALAKAAAQKGWLRLGFLFYNDLAIASQLWLSCNRTAYIMKTVYDQEHKKYSPGKVLTAEMMRYVIDVDKVKVVDYLHGDESYKEDWAPKRRERKGILIYNNHIKGHYLRMLNETLSPILNKNKYLNKVKSALVNRLRIRPSTE